MFRLGDEVLHMRTPALGVGTITTPPAPSWHRIHSNPVERVCWSDGAEGWYHASELAPARG